MSEEQPQPNNLRRIEGEMQNKIIQEDTSTDKAFVQKSLQHEKGLIAFNAIKKDFVERLTVYNPSLKGLSYEEIMDRKDILEKLPLKLLHEAEDLYMIQKKFDSEAIEISNLGMNSEVVKNKINLWSRARPGLN